MSGLLVVILVCSGFVFVDSQRGNSCVTPDKVDATCRPLRQCYYFEKVKANDSSVIALAQKAQCGYDTEPLICCNDVEIKPTEDYVNTFFNRNFVTTTTTTTPNPNQQIYKAVLENFEIKGLSDRTVCGLERSTFKIKGGVYAALGESPWVVALEYKSNITGKSGGIRCGGSLINKRYVLTAAHCLTHREFKITNVRLGEWDTSTDPDCDVENVTDCADKVVFVNVEKIILHDYYSPRTGNSDIGLLRLENDVNFTEYIRPICLPSPYVPLPPDGTHMSVAGWGVTEFDFLSNIKLSVSIPVRPNEVCNEALKRAAESRRVVQNQLCVGGEPGKDSCEGDSGGPLMRAYSDKVSGRTQWYQEGVVSYGIACGANGRPGIYTRVASFVIWISNKVAEA